MRGENPLQIDSPAPRFKVEQFSPDLTIQDLGIDVFAGCQLAGARLREVCLQLFQLLDSTANRVRGIFGV